MLKQSMFGLESHESLRTIGKKQMSQGILASLAFHMSAKKNPRIGDIFLMYFNFLLFPVRLMNACMYVQQVVDNKQQKSVLRSAVCK